MSGGIVQWSRRKQSAVTVQLSIKPGCQELARMLVQLSAGNDAQGEVQVPRRDAGVLARKLEQPHSILSNGDVDIESEDDGAKLLNWSKGKRGKAAIFTIPCIEQT